MQVSYYRSVDSSIWMEALLKSPPLGVTLFLNQMLLFREKTHGMSIFGFVLRLSSPWNHGNPLLTSLDPLLLLFKDPRYGNWKQNCCCTKRSLSYGILYTRAVTCYRPGDGGTDVFRSANQIKSHLRPLRFCLQGAVVRYV